MTDHRPGSLKPAPGEYWRQRRDPFGLNRRYEQVVRLMRPRSAGGRGLSRAKALKQARLTRDAFDRMNVGEGRYDAVPQYTQPRGGGKARIKRWILADEKNARAMEPAPIFQRNPDGTWQTQPQVGWTGRYASIVGSFWNAVSIANTTGNTEPLAAFEGFTVIDINGRSYRLPSVNTVLAWMDAMTDDDWAELWELFESDKSRGGVPSAA
jgi:hypothetical protein